jgi:Fe-S-cluster containining protein
MNSVTVAEAVLLYEDMSRSGAWPRARAEALAQIPLLRGTNAVSWFKMNRPCPVLSSNGMCSAYRVRPIACSTHFVTSDPSSCDPWAMGASEYSPLDFRDVAMEETERMVRTLEEGGILQLELPMPQALMVAERVSTRSGLTLEQVTSYVMNEL